MKGCNVISSLLTFFVNFLLQKNIELFNLFDTFTAWASYKHKSEKVETLCKMYLKTEGNHLQISKTNILSTMKTWKTYQMLKVTKKSCHFWKVKS